MRRPTCRTTSWTIDASAAVTALAVTCCSSLSGLASLSAPGEGGDHFIFARRQRARPSRFQRSKLYRSEFRSYQTLHPKAESFAQSSDLPRLAFRDGEFQIPETAVEPPRRYVARHDQAVLQLYPFGGRSCREGAVATHSSYVRSFDFAARMCQFVRRVTIGGEQKDAFGHVVEPSDVGEAGHVLDQREDRSPALRITARGQDAARL